MKPNLATKLLLVVICTLVAAAAFKLLPRWETMQTAATNTPSRTAKLSKPVKPVKPGKGSAQPKAPVKVIEAKKAPVPLSKRVVEYHISVKLNAEEKKLLGTETLTWKNPGKQPVSELYFHLYPNAFKNKHTTFMKESGGKLRSDKMKDNSYGSMDIVSMKTVDGENLLPRMKYVQPDDGNKNDETLVKVRLPAPVAPNENVTLRLEFNVQLPFAFARSGYAGDFVMAGQWFPKLAVYEPAGTRDRGTEGWNLHQYHGNSEFYADFGIYNVIIEVPSDHIVAATGFPTKTPLIKDNKKTYQFYADDVHDFAWAASPHFVYAEEPFSTKYVPGVKIKLYMDPLHKNLKDRYIEAAKKALAAYSQWYGAYPYSTLSIVIPPKDGNGAGGMEYPTLITGWGAADGNPDLELERVIVHEIGHQYWYGMVASNEFEEAWLDEGFTSYAEDKVMEKEFDQTPNSPLESSYITSPAPLKQLAWEYDHHSHYADNVYTRAKLVLKAIEMQIGPQKMNRVMRVYFQRYKFSHPTTRDFQKVVEQVTGRSWSDFFNQFVYGGMMVDYAVDSIKAKKISSGSDTKYENTVVLSKRAGQYTSVPILFHMKDGTSVIKIWDGQNARTEYKIVSKSPVSWVAVDPNYSMILENRHINNFMKTNVSQEWKTRWNLGSVKIIEALLSWVAW